MERRDLGLEFVELCTGTHGYRYALIKLIKKKRESQIQKIFEVYDRYVTPGMQIKLTNLPNESTIVSFGPGHEFTYHPIYKEIERAQHIKCPSYVYWSRDSGNQSTGSTSPRATTKIRRLLETDSDFPAKKVHSSIHSTDALLSVLGRSQNCSESGNISPIYSRIEIQASNKHTLLVEQLFNPELLAEIEKWDLIEQTLKEDHNENEFEPGCEGSVYFASTPTLPGILKIGGTKFDGATRVRQLYTAGVPERYTCRFEFRCPDWKLFEGVVHEITKVNRLYKRKEFFVMQPEAAAKLIDQINGLIPRTHDEQLEWDYAFKKITIRLEKNRARWAKMKAKRQREEEMIAGLSWAQTTAAMDKLMEEKAILAIENASLRAQLRTMPTEST